MSKIDLGLTQALIGPCALFGEKFTITLIFIDIFLATIVAFWVGAVRPTWHRRLIYWDIIIAAAAWLARLALIAVVPEEITIFGSYISSLTTLIIVTEIATLTLWTLLLSCVGMGIARLWQKVSKIR